MYTICWTSAGAGRWERCENLCEAAKLLKKEGLTNNEDVLIFPPKADKYIETAFQVMEQLQQPQIHQLKVQAIKRLLISGKIKFECTGSEASYDCVRLSSELFREETCVCYIIKMVWENIEEYLAGQIHRLVEEGRVHWKGSFDSAEENSRNLYAIDKIIADLSKKCYLEAEKANCGKRPERYTLSQEAIEAVVVKQNYLDGIISEEEYKKYCREYSFKYNKEQDG